MPSIDFQTVSVIVPTRNRAPYLRMLLNALMAQVYPTERFEVIVVDNESSDDTEAVVSQAAGHALFPVRYFRKTNEGPAVARNFGAARSQAQILAFTDSDCLPSSRWLSSAVSILGNEKGLVCGPIVPVDGEAPAVLSHQVDPTHADQGVYPTANILYRRAIFASLGGFDEQFGAYSWGPPVGGDDTDLGWRVRRAGFGAAFAPLATVFHQSTPMGLKAAMLDPLRAQVVPRLLTLVPELRETFLWHRYFLGRHTAAFYPALVGVLLARRLPWSLLLVGPWLRLFWPALSRDAWPPRFWPRLALRFGVICEAACLTSVVLVWASIRHRRMVL